MGVASVANGSQAIAALSTEYVLTTKQGAGVFQLDVDCSSLQSGDSLTITVKKTIIDGGDDIIFEQAVLSDALTVTGWESIPRMVPASCEIVCSIMQTSGTVRTIPWSLNRA